MHKVEKEQDIDTNRIRSLEGITLGEALEKVPEYEYFGGYIKIGTTRGSGFVYASRLDAFCSEIIDERCIAKKEKAIANAEDRVRQGINRPGADPSDYMKVLLDRSGGNLEAIDPDYDDYVRFVKLQFETLGKRTKYLTKLKKQRASFTPLEGRKVKQAYPTISSFDPAGTVILIVEGYEKGDAWTVDEYEASLDHDAEDKDDVVPFDSPEYDEEFGDE